MTLHSRCAIGTLLLSLAPVLYGTSYTGERVSKTDPNGSCSEPPSTPAFLTTDGAVYLYFSASTSTADSISNDWVAPDNTILSGGYWNPVQGTYCYLGARLNIDPNTAPNRLGQWRARVWDNGALLFVVPFTLNSPSSSSPTGGPTLQSLSRSQVGTGSSQLSAYGSGFNSGAQAAVCCQFNSSNDVGVVGAGFISATELSIGLYLKDPGDFTVRVRNPDSRESGRRALLVGYAGYHLPFPGGTTVHVSQGNNDIFDHNVNVFPSVRWAYDLVGIGSSTVVAMRAGRVVATHDGEGNSCSPSFGNYVTIDHLDGQYSSYAHFKMGTLLVNVGDSVYQGQPLGTMGNSGYAYSNTPCDGGGIHVHVQVTSTYVLSGSQSVPFLFDEVRAHDPDAPPPGQPLRGADIPSQNTSTQSFQTNGIVAQGGWYNSSLTVPGGLRQLKATLDWTGISDLDFYLVSPNGKLYGGTGAVSAEYTGWSSHPEVFTIANPTSGPWTIWVNGWSCPLGQQPFQITVSTQ